MNQAFLQATRQLLQTARPSVDLSWAHWHMNWARDTAPDGVWIRDLQAMRTEEAEIIRLAWRPVDRARGYEIQSNADPSNHQGWQAVAEVPEPEYRGGLGQEIRCGTWIRVRALLGSQLAPWSDPLPVGNAVLSPAPAA